MSSHPVILSAGLHDLDRPLHGALDRFDSEVDDRIGDEFLGQRGAEPGAVGGCHFHPDHRGEPLALESLREEVERLGRVPSCVAVPRGPPHEAVDEDAACSDRRGLVEEEAIGLLDLLLEHLARREDDLEPALALELGQVPAEQRRIADELVGGNFEEHDEPGLVELGGAPVDELHSQGRLSRPGGALDQHDATAQKAAGHDVIQPRDAGLHEVPFRHGQRLRPEVWPGSPSATPLRDRRCLSNALSELRPSGVAHTCRRGSSHSSAWSTSRTYIRPGVPWLSVRFRRPAPRSRSSARATSTRS